MAFNPGSHKNGPKTGKEKKLMAMPCTTCKHPRRAQIDEALVTGSESLSELSHSYGLSPAALHRHKTHIPEALTVAKQAREVSEATTLLERIESLIRECHGIAARAQREKQWIAATGALREVRLCLELLGKLSGELQQGSLLQVQQNQISPPPVLNIHFIKPEQKALENS
jgi:hypothetical protein